MKKHFIISLVLLIIITTFFSCQSKDTERLPASPPDDGYPWKYINSYYSISATSDIPGESCTLKLTYNYNDKSLTKKEVTFNAVCPVDFEFTNFTLFDLNQDNIKDVILEIPTKVNDYGLITQKEVYLVDGNSDDLITIDNALEILEDEIQFSSNESNYYLTIYDSIYTVEKSAFGYLPDEVFADQLHLESSAHWSIDRYNRFYCSINCLLTSPDAEEQITAGSIYAYYLYENGRLIIDDFDFYPSKYNEKIINFETNSENWKLWYNTNYLVLENLNGSKFYFGDTRDIYDVDIQSENAIQFFPLDNNNANAIINDSYAAIIYEGVTFTANEPVTDNIIIVNLETGLIEEKLYTNSAVILNHNKVDSTVLSDYEYSDITPIQYHIKADVEIAETSFLCTFKLLTYDNNISYDYPVIYKTKEAQ